MTITFSKKLARIITPIALSFALITTSFAQTITIRGTGIVKSIPDIAFINIGVNSDAATARIALDKNTKAMNNIINALLKLEIKKSDIQTSNFSINTIYNPTRENIQLPETIGYNVHNSLNISVLNLDNLGMILDKVVTLGSNRISNIRFATADSLPLEDQARKLAAKDAKRRAELYAATLGFSLGKIISINEGDSQSDPASNNLHRGMRMEANLTTDAPIEAGEQTTKNNVTISWEINQ